MGAPAPDLRGKVALFVGGGGFSKEPHYRTLREWGMKTVIVRSPLDRLSSNCADALVTFDALDDHAQDEIRAMELVSLLEERAISPDCVCTIWEDCGPLAAHVSRLLGLPGIDPQAANTAKSKIRTQDRLRASTSNDIASLAVRTALATTSEELVDALRVIGLPAVLKLEYGSSAAGVLVVRTAEEAIEQFASITNTLQREEDCPGIGLGFGANVILSELLVGSEHDVDLVMWQGEIIAAFTTDNGPTRIPNCSETTALMPSVESPDTQQSLVWSGAAACAEVGIDTGVINVEMIKTDAGVRVIDLNARMGGFYIRDWISRLWDYDLLFAAVSCALGSRPPSCGRPNGWIAGAMIVPSAHMAWMNRRSNQARLFDISPSPAEIVNIFDRHARSMKAVDEPFGNLAVWSDTPNGAVASLVDAWKRWGLFDYDPGFHGLLPPLASQ